jgi:hypothetical protein
MTCFISIALLITMPTFLQAFESDAPRLETMRELVRYLKERGPAVAGDRYLAGTALDEAELDLTCWLEIVDLYRTAGLRLFEEQLAVILRKFMLTGPLDGEIRKSYGRVILQSTLIEIWTSTSLPKAAVEDVVRKLPLQSVDIARMTIASLPLGRYIIWSTFGERDPDGDPFDPRDPVERLIDDLGLKFYSGDIFYLLCYTIPGAVEIRFPTLADAYSGGFFFPFKSGGRTFPIRHPDKLSGRPERVHSVIFGRELRRSVDARTLGDERRPVSAK